MGLEEYPGWDRLVTNVMPVSGHIEGETRAKSYKSLTRNSNSVREAGRFRRVLTGMCWLNYLRRCISDGKAVIKSLDTTLSIQKWKVQSINDRRMD